MGQKGKIGKQRKDNFYKLAKQKGFRARSAFKLIQLNRKFQFLENSRVCIDLCAAPGGWLQVASEYMPVSSVIIGVDLVPIAPIRNVITFQADITTPECSETIEKNLSSWKADLVLNDGAPNVGKNWLHDAYNQNVLVVSALKIACTHLRKGGCFITKIFRSSDYNSLIWVFGKLFGKVHATKPQASRSESAEIFVVCQNYRCPSDIDPKFFDPTALFADISDFDEKLKKQKADLLKPLNKIKKAKAVGYEDDEVYKIVNDLQFVTCNNPLDHLAQYNKINIQNKDILAHQLTNDEVKECCQDLRILGRKELKLLIDWRREIRKDIFNKLMEPTSAVVSEISDDEEEVDDEVPQCLDDINSMEDIERKKEEKRVKRKEEKKRKDYEQRVTYGMVNHGDVLIEEENDLFSLNKFVGKSQLDKINDVEPDALVDSDNEHEPEDPSKKSKKVMFAREAEVQYFELDDDYGDEDSDEVDESKAEDIITVPKSIIKKRDSSTEMKKLDKDINQGGGLLTDLEDISSAKAVAAKRFFDRATFKSIDLESRFETDLIEKITDRKSENPSKSDDDVDLSRFSDSSSDDEEEVEKPPKKIKKLDPEGLALAAMMKAHPKDVEDDAWNRYAHADSHLAPKWFKDDEAKHCRRTVPVSQELVKEYKQRLREIDAKPIKKVLQAKARKKRRAMKKMDKVKKKVDAIVSNEDITQQERNNQVKAVYKNATKKKKQEVKLVVARKGVPASKPNKGKYKMVDQRMKKDIRAKQRREGKKGKGKGSSRGISKGRSRDRSNSKSSSQNSSKSNFRGKSKSSSKGSSKGRSKIRSKKR